MRAHCSRNLKFAGLHIIWVVVALCNGAIGPGKNELSLLGCVVELGRTNVNALSCGRAYSIARDELPYSPKTTRREKVRYYW